MLDIYTLELFARKCLVEVTINGMFVFRRNAGNGVSCSYPFNTELIGKGNNVKITAYPTMLDEGRMSLYCEVTIEGAIKIYGEREITGPESGVIIERISFTDVIARNTAQIPLITDIGSLFPMSKTYVFDNEGPAFRNRFIDADPVTDEKVLLDYAERLRDILRGAVLDDLWAQYCPKIVDYAKAYPAEFPDPRGWFDEFFLNDFFPGGPVTDFGRDDIGARPWCEGRIWELYVKPDFPLFTNTGLDGDINSIEVYVGLDNGVLRIIR